MYRKIIIHLLKHGVYLCLLLLFYVVQTNPYFFSFWGIKPLLVVPLAVVIAMQEGEFAGAWYGAAAGALCDLSMTKLFGLNAILLMLCCVAIGLAIIYLVQLSPLNALLLTGTAMLVKDLFNYYFYYAMWGYEQVYLIFIGNMLPELVFTLGAEVLIYWMLTRIKAKFDSRLGE